jgi:hypothetical protein
MNTLQHEQIFIYREKFSTPEKAAALQIVSPPSRPS